MFRVSPLVKSQISGSTPEAPTLAGRAAAADASAAAAAANAAAADATGGGVLLLLLRTLQGGLLLRTLVGRGAADAAGERC